MARRSEEYARIGSHGGYTQALAVGKGFSGTSRSTVKQQAGRGSGQGGGSSGTMNAYARHKELISNYHRYHLNAQVPSAGAIEAKGLPGQRRLTDQEALRRQHRFVRDSEEDHRANEARGLEGEEADPNAWEVRMAAKYYRLLFKEYALADLSRYREDKVGLRWRTEKDVVSGKGQFECGALGCQERSDLHSYELNFKYKEAGSVKNELVKVRVCPQCARKLFRKKIEALQRQHEQEQKEAAREQRRRAKAAGSSTVAATGDGGSGGTGETAHETARLSAASLDGGSVERGEAGRGRGEGGSSGGVSGRSAGHDLVMQAVAAATASAGASTAATGATGGGGVGAARKRRRPSRWGDKLAPQETATETGGGGGLPGEVAPTGDAAARKAWAGELERDRTAEDEMDDYLSSLLL